VTTLSNVSTEGSCRIDDIEDQLVRRARQGDAGAYGELVRRHQPAALRVATVVLGTTEGADDVVQQAMERAWRAMPRFDERRPFRPWLLRIVANAARNDRRARGRFARLAVRAASHSPDGNGAAVAVGPEEATVADGERRRVVEALNRLRAEDRIVIALRHFEQLSEREMVDVLDVPRGTVKSRLSRAMTRLRAELDRDEEVSRHG
jgi:RNA polymerase sigma factor (sigma-70 family)